VPDGKFAQGGVAKVVCYGALKTTG
jgi:hypothetical protein